MNISKRILNMSPSSILELAPYADAAKAMGKKVYHLNIGDPDIKTPSVFFDGLKEISIETLGYGPSRGIDELLDAQIDYYKKFSVEVKREDLIITTGASEALLYAMMATCDDGDDILTCEPYYANYEMVASSVGANMVVFPTTVENGFRLPTKEEIVSAITPKTKVILLSHPGNPTGVVYTEEEMELIADIAIENNLFIIADEVYREFTYNSEVFKSFGTIKRIEDRVLLVDSISKRFSACGARIGSVMCKNEELNAGIMKLCEIRLSAATIDQICASKLYGVDKSYYEDVTEEYKSRRDFLISELSTMEGVKYYVPAGAFYVMPELPVDDAVMFSKWLLTDFDIDGETLMIAPGKGFYCNSETGKSQVRIAYVLNNGDLKKALKILREGLLKYPGRN
ncbi:MAG: pyridoxal phosphate-dependent aminotransferase [Tissierellia bacterium]|nr:pyridoxal phosphate-dependent aminotransferase [Tissierellia bacterium]